MLETVCLGRSKVSIMGKRKVMTIFGTRPEAIKMAPLVLELQQYEDIESIVTVTAQHRQMLDQVLDIFGIQPHYDLNIMKERQTLVDITTRALAGLDDVMKKSKARHRARPRRHDNDICRESSGILQPNCCWARGSGVKNVE